MAQSQGGWLSPGCGSSGGGEERGGRSDVKEVDIIQMLTKARTEFVKVLINSEVVTLSPHFFLLHTIPPCFGQSTSEPKQIGGSGILSGNPNLIKPIPVKPNAQV